MTVFQAIVLGVLQGLAEFLPISSSAHLALAPWVFGWQDPGLAFDVALHVGTLAAVLWYFRRDWLALGLSAIDIMRKRAVTTPEEGRVVFLVIATIPGAIAGVLLEDAAETTLRAPALIAVMLMIMGVVLWAADKFSRADRPLADMRWRDAVVIGIAQSFALVPGVSRSGATMTAARLFRFDRRSAAVFSFLLSTPITAAAAVVKVPDALAAGGLSAPLIAGVLAAALSAWLAIAVLLRYLAQHTFAAFALYRLALGALILALVALRG